ncbi:nicotinate-nucleotide pyrophosphorylase [carboxylating]-like isoform X2 [Thalassophryne amazonica]|uniref:nicotinate-nucleotide pyrophosphorylase [carboxylating]-like isoform X2 n=1 Tax=Thalassophryne amazonica TaxID=390379 RepID=UPI001472178D|nr:nicotinate-nucleotide pyrophosphorylase [carboxylating]-like isoform X2 [Thalassophryne amazonica]
MRDLFREMDKDFNKRERLRLLEEREYEEHARREARVEKIQEVAVLQDMTSLLRQMVQCLPATQPQYMHSAHTSCRMSSHTVSDSIPPHTLRRLAGEWLAEDTPNFDPAGVCVGSQEVEAGLLCKTACSVLAGSPFFTAVFTEVGCTVDWIFHEGTQIVGVVVFIIPLSGPDAVTLTAVVRGPARGLLLGERPALNCLARASGIATRCSQLQAVVKAAGWHGEVAGTRKTTPGFRLVEKYAMLVGGVSMHRQDLSGMVMLKDNHIWASGCITEAVKAARTVCGFSSKIEVECRSAEEGSQAARAGADIVMLDNFQPQDLHVTARALKEEFPSLLIEASGGVTPETLTKYLSPHVDIVSLGCITQGCPIVDFSLKVQKPVTHSSLQPLCKDSPLH